MQNQTTSIHRIFSLEALLPNGKGASFCCVNSTLFVVRTFAKMKNLQFFHRERNPVFYFLNWSNP
jgi:hypothetical protein